MRATILIDPEKPKVDETEVTRMLEAAGFDVSRKNADLGVVVGGDGIFSYYGRMISSLPLLFVGLRSNDVTASKGYLAEVYFDDLPAALREIKREMYRVMEYRRLEIEMNGSKRGEVFTDVYVEKGADSNCLRYHLDVEWPGGAFTDSAIANGVIICTSAGSTGYYSYADKLRLGDRLDSDEYSTIPESEIGVCHIAPLLTSRDDMPERPLFRYTVPWGSTFKIRLTRDADARLFGLTRSRRGIRIRVGDTLEVRPSATTTRIIKLKPPMMVRRRRSVRKSV
jgi:hypothetical protein